MSVPKTPSNPDTPELSPTHTTKTTTNGIGEADAGLPHLPLVNIQDSLEPQKPDRHPLAVLPRLVTGPKGRWATVFIWLALVVILVLVAPNLANYYDNSQTSGIGDQESVRASQLLEQKFPQEKGLPAIIVFNDPKGLSQQDYATAQKVSDWLNSNQKPALVATTLSIFSVPQAKAQLVSANGTTMQIIASLTGSPNDDSFNNGVKQIRNYLKQSLSKGSSLDARLSGPAGVSTDAIEVFSGADITLLLSTVALVLVLLLVTYRSPLLAILPLLAVGVVSSITNGLLGFAAQAGWFAVTQQSASVLTILLFGAGTDYTIFIVARYREELQHQSNRQLALQHALVRVNEAITSSAGIVIVALLTLLLTTLELYHSLGPVLAIGIAVMLLAGLTLVPALLAILGKAAFWPFIPKIQTENRRQRRGFWNWVGGIATNRPVASVWASSLLLLILGLGNLGVSDVYNFLTGFRQPTDSATGYKYLAANFPPGVLAPFDIVINFKDGSNAYLKLSAIDQIQQAVSKVPNVDKVVGPTRLDGQQLIAPDLNQFQQQLGALPPALIQSVRSGQGGSAGDGADSQIVGLYAQTVQYISNDNTTVRLSVTLKSDPYGVPAINTIDPIRVAARAAVKQAGLNSNTVSVQLGGVTPTQSDTRDVSNADKLLVIPVVLILTALILGLLLRSVVAPLYLLLAVTLNFFAAVGIASFLFTTIQGDDGLAYSIPLYTFIFLVALGADYTIFLMSRVREEVVSFGLVEGTRDALSHTGGVITSAGVILAGTFLVLATLPLRDLYQLGVTVAIGILFDTFIVRGLLVPATVVLLKDANWWPSKLHSNTK